MKNREFKTLNTGVLMLLILVLALFNGFIYYVDHIYAAVSICISIVLVAVFISKQKRISKDVTNSYNALGSIVSGGAKYINMNLPIAMIIVSEDGEVMWYNEEMKAYVEEDNISNTRVEEFMPDLDFNSMLSHYREMDEVDDSDIKYAENTNKYEVRMLGRYFDIKSCRYKESVDDDTYYYAVYFYEVTLYKEYEKKYNTERPVIGYVEVDNYDDIMTEISEDKRPFMSSEIERTIRLWATRMNALIKKYEKDKYVLVISYSYFENLESKKFAILDEIRAIDIASNINPTISVGFCADDLNFSSLENEAFQSLEIALGRGGDQAVVRKNGEYAFYGGKSAAVEKRNRVKARIVAHAFRPIIDESNVVYIMGHQYADMDAFGAAIGVYRAAVNRNKKARIVISGPNDTISSVYETFESDDNYVFIKPVDALAEIDYERDLLVVVDTHRPSFTECPELLEKASRKVLIDHHRRGIEFIDDTLLTYLEPYASSACELVTEVLQYMENKINISKKEAEALLAGIVVDTKNFTFKSGVRTFESAAVLKKCGADTTIVKEFMQDDIDSFIVRSNIISNSRIIYDNIAISVSDNTAKNVRLIAAQAADAMLSIRGIVTSFVIVKSRDEIFVSARSLKDVNVQVIMEKLGGGGHRAIAGAQFKDRSIKEVEHLLLKEIKEYMMEE